MEGPEHVAVTAAALRVETGWWELLARACIILLEGLQTNRGRGGGGGGAEGRKTYIIRYIQFTQKYHANKKLVTRWAAEHEPTT